MPNMFGMLVRRQSGARKVGAGIGGAVVHTPGSNILPAYRGRAAGSMLGTNTPAESAPAAPYNPAADPAVQQRQQWRDIRNWGGWQGSQSSGTPMYGGGYYSAPDLQNSSLSDADQTQVNRIRMQDAASGSGPYDGVAGAQRFGPPQGMQPESPLMVRGPGPLTGEAGRIAAINAAGGNMAYRDTFGTPNAANQAYAARADDRAAGLREGRRNRAIAKYGLTHLQPTQNYTYDSAIGGVGGYRRNDSQFGAPPSPGIANVVESATKRDEKGNIVSRDWNIPARMMFDDPNFKKNPQAAWDEIRKSGMTSAEVAALLDDAEGGLFGLGSDQDPEYIKWLQGLGAAAGIQGAPTAPGYAPAGPLGKPEVAGRGGQVAPPLPRDSQVQQPPPPLMTEPGLTDEYFPPVRTPPPRTPPLPGRRPTPLRPGFVYRPNF